MKGLMEIENHKTARHYTEAGSNKKIQKILELKVNFVDLVIKN